MRTRAGFALAGILVLAAVSVAEQGPRMTDADLFGALNLDHPGLAEVEAAVTQNDIPGAKAALAAYYRNREKPVWQSGGWWGGGRGGGRSGRGAEFYRRRLEETMDRTFTVVGVPHRFGAGSDIDWAFNPTGGRVGDRVPEGVDVAVQPARGVGHAGDGVPGDEGRGLRERVGLPGGGLGARLPAAP